MYSWGLFSQMKKKFLIFIGPTRTSTTSIFRYISSLDEFNCARNKETNHFIKLLTQDDNFNFKNYLKEFSTSDNLFVEASPLYFLHGEKLAGKISHLKKYGEVKLVITLRDPIERYLSLYKHISTKRSLDSCLNFTEFNTNNINALLSPKLTKDNLDNLSLYESCYVDLLRQWKSVFDSNDLRVIFFENITSPERFLDEMDDLLFWFTKKKVALKNKKFLYENKSTQVKNKKIHKFSLKINDFLEPTLNRLPWLRNIVRDTYYFFNSVDEKIEVSPNNYDRIVKNCNNGNKGLLNELTSLATNNYPEWVHRYK